MEIIMTRNNKMIFSKASNKCLFCKVPCSPPYIEEEIALNTGTSDDASSKELLQTPKKSDWTSCSCKSTFSDDSCVDGESGGDAGDNAHAFRSRLKRAFILKELLSPQEASYALSSKDLEQEDYWFSVCASCHEFVDEGHSIYHQIAELNKKFDLLKCKLKGIITIATSQDDFTVGSNQKVVEEESGMEDENSTYTAEAVTYLYSVSLSGPFLFEAECTQKPADVVTEKSSAIKTEAGDFFQDNFADLFFNSVGGEYQELDSSNSDLNLRSKGKDTKQLKSVVADIADKLTQRTSQRNREEPDSDYEPDEASDDEDDSPEKIALFPCKVCCAVYGTKHRLKEHEELHSLKKGIMKCDKCRFVARSSRHVKIHKKQVHQIVTERKLIRKNRCHLAPSKDEKAQKPGDYVCSKCGVIYKAPHRLKEHEGLHSRKDVLTCKLCKFVCLIEAGLKIHVSKYHKKATSSLLKVNSVNKNGDKDKAEDGGKEGNLVNDSHARKKKKTQDGSSRKQVAQNTLSGEHQFNCSYCNAVFPTANRLRFHVARAHDKIHNVCTQCGYKAHGASHLRLHMQKHTKEKLVMCEICSRTFTSPSYLEAHKQKDHYQELGLSPIKCELCDMHFPSKPLLKYHMQRKHEKKFNFSCEICGKGYLFASQLKYHSIAHQTERNQICQYCGAAYADPRVLLDHFQNHHPEAYAAAKGIDVSTLPPSNVANEGPFICKFCSQEFAMRWNLIAHLRTHTEVYEKYKCTLCEKGFSTQAGLKRHEGTSHFPTVVTCEFCSKEFACKDYLRYHLKKHCRKKVVLT